VANNKRVFFFFSFPFSVTTNRDNSGVWFPFLLFLFPLFPFPLPFCARRVSRRVVGWALENAYARKPRPLFISLSFFLYACGDYTTIMRTMDQAFSPFFPSFFFLSGLFREYEERKETSFPFFFFSSLPVRSKHEKDEEEERRQTSFSPYFFLPLSLFFFPIYRDGDPVSKQGLIEKRIASLTPFFSLFFSLPLDRREMKIAFPSLQILQRR